jgi:hypothetical protein
MPENPLARTVARSLLAARTVRRKEPGERLGVAVEENHLKR